MLNDSSSKIKIHEKLGLGITGITSTFIIPVLSPQVPADEHGMSLWMLDIPRWLEMDHKMG